MDFNKEQQLIVDLINEYDDMGYILSYEILSKYEQKINELKKEIKE
jgi:hypothetical protein